MQVTNSNSHVHHCKILKQFKYTAANKNDKHKIDTNKDNKDGKVVKLDDTNYNNLNIWKYYHKTIIVNKR